MADKKIIMQDPLSGDRLFPIVTVDSIYEKDNTVFLPIRVESFDPETATLKLIQDEG